jgi:hypothetical protein
MLAKQVLYLSHVPSPFRSAYFGDGDGEVFAWVGLKL